MYISDEMWKYRMNRMWFFVILYDEYVYCRMDRQCKLNIFWDTLRKAPIFTILWKLMKLVPNKKILIIVRFTKKENKLGRWVKIISVDIWIQLYDSKARKVFFFYFDHNFWNFLGGRRWIAQTKNMFCFLGWEYFQAADVRTPHTIVKILIFL